MYNIRITVLPWFIFICQEQDGTTSLVPVSRRYILGPYLIINWSESLEFLRTDITDPFC
jgi:hypothetical protein